MLISKRDVEVYIEKKIPNIMFDAELKDKVYNYCYKEFNMPISLIDDFLTMRKALNEANDFILFIIVKGFEYNKVPGAQAVDKIFTANEITMYSQYTYQIEEIEFPIRFKMVQVTDGQWIGSIDTKTLMLLRRAQMIKYNEHTQRIMQRIVRGNKEYYKISVNQKAVQEISELLQKELYISDTITFNIPMESMDADFYYDAKNSELVINHLSNFDILDGYHRYLGIGQISDLTPEFNYPMELRIVNWDIEKARRFVFQMDKKNKMRKVDSLSFDASSVANRITSRLNESAQCSFRGEIRSNGGLLPYADIASYINVLFCKDIPKGKENYCVLHISSDIIESLNALVEYDMTYLSRHYEKKEMVVMFYMCSKYFEKDKQGIGLATKMMMNAIHQIDARKFYSFPNRVALLKNLDQVWDEVKKNVQ